MRRAAATVRAGAGTVMSWAQRRIGRMLARYLEKPATGYEPFTPSNPDALAGSLKPGDVLLVEGNNHIAGVIKYLTQSTWSHAAPVMDKFDNGEAHVLIEAEIGQGVISVPLSKYFKFHTRVCRPVGLAQEDVDKVCRYAIDRIGLDYDLKNIIDLLRYLMPLPIPQRWRRRMIALGSGDPTRIICSALIAQAFESVRYPILPRVTQIESRQARRDILEIRHSSLYAPRDFDISPYFEVVKPTIVSGFDYKAMHWADLPLPPDEDERRSTVPSLASAKTRTKRPGKRPSGSAKRAPRQRRTRNDADAGMEGTRTSTP
jgi:Permuted papain-like amidase enzyme, YaeF/YiiX, C92 family